MAEHGPSEKACDDCDGTGEVFEPCGCYECEYDDRHGGMIPCASCTESSSPDREGAE